MSIYQENKGQGVMPMAKTVAYHLWLSAPIRKKYALFMQLKVNTK
ncbi:hypothetical protein [Brenneria roseae]|nr:hypothetical protein [Brenneria roseae]